MKAGLKKTIEQLKGLDELIPQSPDSATTMVNFTIDPKTGGWDNRIGYEKFFASGAFSLYMFGAPIMALEPTISTSHH